MNKGDWTVEGIDPNAMMPISVASKLTNITQPTLNNWVRNKILKGTRRCIVVTGRDLIDAISYMKRASGLSRAERYAEYRERHPRKVYLCEKRRPQKITIERRVYQSEYYQAHRDQLLERQKKLNKECRRRILAKEDKK